MTSGVTQDILTKFFAKCSSKAQAIKAFKKVDIDGSGTLSIKELVMVMRDFGVNLTEKQAEIVSKSLDSDNSGELEIQEMLDMLFKERCRILKARLTATSFYEGRSDPAFQFSTFDRDNNGVLVFEEFRGVIRKVTKMTQVEMPDSELNEMFKHIMKRGDGGISMDAYSQFMKPDQSRGGEFNVTDCFGFIYDYLQETRQSQKTMFQRWSGDGHELSAEEFRLGLQSLGMSKTRDELGLVFQALDTTGDGAPRTRLAVRIRTLPARECSRLKRVPNTK